MKFSERHDLLMRAEKYCEDNGVKPSPFNIISALDILGCLVYRPERAAQDKPARLVQPGRMRK
jgi:hypothetical protein